MNPYDIELTEMHFNNSARIFALFVVLLLIIAAAYFYNDQSDMLMVDGLEVTTAYDDTTASETTVTETTAEPEAIISYPDVIVPETTIHDTTVQGTTIPETTDPETTLSDTTVPEITAPPEPEPYIVLTESERLILATLLRLECGGCTYECQMAVASVVLNRMDVWDKTLREVVFGKNAFSPARLISKKTGKSYYNPSKDGMYKICWQVVDDICANGPTVPRCVIYFRSKRYHSWAPEYAKIDLLYFSYDKRYV
jgi:hypothetical protein